MAVIANRIKGFADMYPPQSSLFTRMENTAREIFSRYGFVELRTPVLEYTDLFKRSIGEETDVVQKEMFTFPDRKGRMMTMRPEATAGVMRAYVEDARYSRESVSRLFTTGPMFRYERPQKGRMRQFHQINCECLGSHSPYADADLIIMLTRFLTALGLKDLTLKLNSLGCAHCRPLFKQALVDYLASMGIRAERQSIYDDIRMLNEYGIEVLYRRGSNGGYYVAQRDFELSELKLLVDAVLSSRFLTAAQSSALIKKLATLSSTHEAELLRRQIVLSGRLKAENDASISNIDTLYEAIDRDSQVVFRYFDWGVDLKKHFRRGRYTASPFALLWDNENYYLIAYTEKHGITHYRVDKMEEIFLTGQKRVFTEESRKFDPAAYSREVFGMYRGKTQQVKLRFDNALAGVVVDRFGRDILLIPDGDEHFTLTVKVSLSPNFLGWLAGFGGRASVIFPQSAVDAYASQLKEALAALS